MGTECRKQSNALLDPALSLSADSDASYGFLLVQVGFFFCTLVSMGVSAYSVVVSSIQEELGTSRLLAISGLSLFTLTFGAAPLVLAPLSEVSST